MFSLNGTHWEICFVQPLSRYLRRSDGSYTVGMCDGVTNKIFLSNALERAFLEKVLCHELTHALCMSYNIFMPIEQEEYICDFMSMYGKEIVYLLDDVLRQMQRRAV